MFPRRSIALLLATVALGGAAADQASAEDKPHFQKVTPITAPDKEAQRWADKMLKKLSLEEKIGQMIQVRGIMEFENVENPEWKDLVGNIRKYHLGSVLLTVKTEGPELQRHGPFTAAMTANDLQRESKGKVPLIFAADFERGASMRLLATPAFPHAMAFGATHDPSYAERFGKVVGEESRALGIAWNYFPVADVNANPANPVINTRSFGEDPQEVGAMSAAYIKGAHAAGLLTTAKHFPGHGDTDTDSHLQVSRVNQPLARIEAVELPPFKQDIAAGVDAVMVAHVAFPALEPDPNRVSSVSPSVITGLLRDKLGFKGVVVTDAMEMKGLTKLYPATLPNPSGSAAVDAIQAGNDLVELPSDLDGTYRGILEAVKRGEISKSRIDASVRRILLVKAEVGLNKGGYVDINKVREEVGKPENFALAQEIAEHAVTLVRDNNQMLPLGAASVMEAGNIGQPQSGTLAAGSAYQNQAGGGKTASLGALHPLLALLFVDDMRGDQGRMMERQIRARIPNAQVVYVDNRRAGLEAEGILALAPQYQRLVAAVYSVPAPGLAGANGTAMPAGAATLLERMLEVAGERMAVVAMGSPYTILNYPNIKTYLCTFSSVATSEMAAVKALFGEMPIHGKLPVTLPNVAQRDTGLDREATAAPPAVVGLPLQ